MNPDSRNSSSAPSRSSEGLAATLSGRRGFLVQTGGTALLGFAAHRGAGNLGGPRARAEDAPRGAGDDDARCVRLFLCGDVMTGRGIDQIMPHPGDPRLYEPYVHSSVRYLEIAEEASGAIPQAVAPGYIWGDTLPLLDRVRPDARIVNLETAVTQLGAPWPGKGVHYRMRPANVACLTAARLDCCVLANNHVLDWGYEGLSETLAALEVARLRFAGAGRDIGAASAPAAIELPLGGRVLVFAFGSPSSGVPEAWAATPRRAGVCLLDENDSGALEQVAQAVRSARRPGDLVIASIHWGSNWGYEVPDRQRRLARRLVEQAGVDLVHGHSSHHPRPLEVHAGKLILYGCGDFLNDYEGIGGQEEFRPMLGFMYLPELDAASGRLVRLAMVPTRIERFRVNLASAAERDWLVDSLNGACRDFGTHLVAREDGSVELHWL